MGGRHALEGSVAAYVYHNDDPNVTRPGTFGAVVWIGSVEPVNSIDGDFWESGATSDVGTIEDYILKGGSRAFTGPVGGVDPTDPAHLATKDYTDSALASAEITGLREVVTFTSNGSFVKGNYPWLRAVRVRLVAGGGGSGNNGTNAARAGSDGADGIVILELYA